MKNTVLGEEIEKGVYLCFDLEKKLNNIVTFYKKKEMIDFLFKLNEEMKNLKPISFYNKEIEVYNWIKNVEYNQNVMLKGLFRLKEPFYNYKFDMQYLFLYIDDDFMCFRYGLIINTNYVSFENWILWYNYKTDKWCSKEKSLILDPYFYSDFLMYDVVIHLQKRNELHLIPFIKK